MLFFSTQPVCYCFPAEVVYHGSPIFFDYPKNMFNTRIGNNNEIIWRGEAVFAAPDRRVALVYTANRDVDCSKYTFGVDLINFIGDKELLTVVLAGPSEEDALNHVYGKEDDEHTSIGYLYKLNAKFFHHESGLGAMELISKTPEKQGFLVSIEKINRRQELNQYIQKGLIKIDFKPIESLKLCTSNLPK